MPKITQQWELFGFDVRLLGKYWRSAWRGFLWGIESPIKIRLDEVVQVQSEVGVTYYQAEHQVPETSAECEAFMLPQSLVLVKALKMPLAVEGDLDIAMEMEVRANSPFPQDDTGSGWKIVSRDQESLHIQLAIVSLSSTMTYLGQEFDCHDVRAKEVWVEVGPSVLVLDGFGEGKRLARYNKRLVRVVGFLLCSLLILMSIFGLSAGIKYLELEHYREMSADIAGQAKDASRMRGALLEANETIAYVNSVIVENPNSRQVLARLTKLLGDDASVVNFSLRGKQLKLLGRASNAAKVIQELTGEPTFAKVESRTAITTVGATEQFTLEIELKGASSL